MKRILTVLLIACVFIMPIEAKERSQELIATITTDSSQGELIQIYIKTSFPGDFVFEFGENNSVDLNTPGLNLYFGGSKYMGNGGVIKIYGDYTNVTGLKMESSKVTDLDLSKLTQIDEILLTHERSLKEIDLSHQSLLTNVSIESGGLESINFGSVSKIETLNLYNNKLKSLDVSNLTELTSLNVKVNELESLDLSNNTNITSLLLSDNSLKSIDLSPFDKLNTLELSNLGLTEIDLSGKNTLRSLDVSKNELTSINVFPCPNLNQLNCSGNKLEKLDLSRSSVLTSIMCNNNQIEEISLSSLLGALAGFNCSNNRLTFANLPLPRSNWSAYTYFPQAMIEVPEEADMIDLSSQYNINGKITEYTFFTEFFDELVEGVDYMMNEGVFTFLKDQEEKVYCEMNNASFPMNIVSMRLRTNYFMPKAGTSIDNNEDRPVISIEDRMIKVEGTPGIKVVVYDIYGRLVNKSKFGSGVGKISISSNGVFILKVIENKKAFSQKIIIN